MSKVGEFDVRLFLLDGDQCVRRNTCFFSFLKSKPACSDSSAVSVQESGDGDQCVRRNTCFFSFLKLKPACSDSSAVKRSIEAAIMRRQDQYVDSGVNQMVAAQMRRAQAQRLQQDPGMGHYPGRANSTPADEEHQYMSTKAEGQWQWDGDGTRRSNVMSSHMYKEALVSDAQRSSYQGQRPDPRLGLEKQANKDPRAQAHGAEMEVGCKDNTLPQTFEILEQKFIQDIMKLTKEQQDAEDTENARHRERLSETNSQYQEKLLYMRAHQAIRREEILRKESQARHQQYQEPVNMSGYPSNAGPSDAHGFGSACDANRAFGVEVNYVPYGERSGLNADPRARGYENRGQYPGGRAYNAGGRHF